MQDASNKIQVKVETNYLDRESDPQQERFVFSYTITISNLGDQAARLINRHWIITDANGKVDEVRGEGVVGEQPYLKPGEAFRYTSGTVIATPVGSMQGSYEMQSDDGTLFAAPIDPFSLAVASQLH